MTENSRSNPGPANDEKHYSSVSLQHQHLRTSHKPDLFTCVSGLLRVSNLMPFLITRVNTCAKIALFFLSLSKASERHCLKPLSGFALTRWLSPVITSSRVCASF